MTRARPRARSVAALLAVNSILLVLLLHAFEGFCRLTDPRRGLPPDGGSDTWGHLVKNNALGFREREIPETRPTGTLRVPALGDSLTWGVGVAEDERYTALLERFLAGRLQHAKGVEVLNFGVSGASTVSERGILEDVGGRVRPDLVLVGSCLNDPQPRGQDWSPERERLGMWLAALPFHPDETGLSATAVRLHRAVFALAERLSLVPTWARALDRAYDPSSPQWQGYLRALDGIAAYCREHRLSPPVFAVLSCHRRSEAGEAMWAMLTRWYAQAARAAAQRGFSVVEFDRGIAAIPLTSPCR